MEERRVQLTGRQRMKVFLPLAGYLAYVAYLAFVSSRPFLVEWLEGCFGLFVALVFCNILRRKAVTEAERKVDAEGDHP